MGGLERLILVTALIAAGAAFPALVARARKPSAILLLLSTGGLVALYFGELIPEVLHEGGWLSVVIILGVWALFSRIPGLHHHGSGQEHVGHDHEDSYPGLLVLSMSAHGLASGALLFTTTHLSGYAADAAFGALLAHKGYEAISVSSLLREKVLRTRRYLALLSVYVFSFPAGYAAAAASAWALGGGLDAEHVEQAATILGSLAIGSLMSCMLHDFLQPSLRRIRERRSEAVWLVLGAVISLLLTSGGGHGH